jgi:hypothetical protein
MYHLLGMHQARVHLDTYLADAILRTHYLHAEQVCDAKSGGG